METLAMMAVSSAATAGTTAAAAGTAASFGAATAASAAAYSSAAFLTGSTAAAGAASSGIFSSALAGGASVLSAGSSIGLGSILSGGFSVISGLQQYNSQRAMGEAQASQAMLQSRQSAISAKQETLRGQQDANSIKQRMLEVLARNRAAAGSSGISLSSGSIRDVENEVISQANRQLDVSRTNADLSALSDEITGAGYAADAQGYRTAGRRRAYASLFDSGANLFERFS